MDGQTKHEGGLTLNPTTLSPFGSINVANKSLETFSLCEIKHVFDPRHLNLYCHQELPAAQVPRPCRSHDTWPNLSSFAWDSEGKHSCIHKKICKSQHITPQKGNERTRELQSLEPWA